jgi:hypothetical protein
MIRPQASAFWGCFGGNLAAVGYGRDVLFGHEVRKVSEPRMTLWYTLSPAAPATSIPSAPLRTLAVGRAFPLRPGAAVPDPVADTAPLARFLRELDGKFRLLLFRGESMTLATDLLGTGAVYYGVFDGRLYFGTHLGPLLEVLPRVPQPNRLAVAALLLTWSQVFEDTHFTGVKRLQAGRFLNAAWDPQRAAVEVRTHEYGNLAEILLEGGPEPSDPAVGRDLLRASQIREGYDETTALMLSGGRDSKALALTRSPGLRQAITYGEPDSSDVRGGRRLARKLGMKHHTVPYGSWNLDTYSDMIVGLNAGYSGLQTTYNIVGYDWARKVCKLTVNGFLSGATSGPRRRSKPQFDLESARDALLMRPSPLVAEVFPDEAKALDDWMEGQLVRYRGLTPAQSFMILKMSTRQTWLSSTFDLCAWMTPVSHPFFYRPLLQWAFRLPTEELEENRAYLRWITQEQSAQGADITEADKRWDRITDRYNRWRHRRASFIHVFWPNVLARTDPSLVTRHAGVMEELDRLTRESWRDALQATRNSSAPAQIFVLSTAISAAFRMAERSSSAA